MMKATKLEAVFILIVLGLMHMTLNAESVTGNQVITLTDNFHKSFLVEEGESLLIENKGNYFDIRVLRIHQDYALNLEFATFIIDVGNKRITLNEGDSISVDLENDGEDDVMLWLESVSSSKASVMVIS